MLLLLLLFSSAPASSASHTKLGVSGEDGCVQLKGVCVRCDPFGRRHTTLSGICASGFTTIVKSSANGDQNVCGTENTAAASDACVVAEVGGGVVDSAAPQCHIPCPGAYTRWLAPPPCFVQLKACAQRTCANALSSIWCHDTEC